MSKQPGALDRDRFNILLMGAIDNELSDKKQLEFEQLLNQFEVFNIQYQEFKELKEVTSTMKFKSPPPEIWDNYWTSVYNRIERGIGWIIFSIGIMLLVTYGLFKAIEAILIHPQLADIVKIGILALLAGFFILIISVFKEKFVMRKSDRYKEVIR